MDLTLFLRKYLMSDILTFFEHLEVVIIVLSSSMFSK